MSLSDIAAVATALGVVLVAVQLWYGRRQARIALEDTLTAEYRELALALPTEMFFDPHDDQVASEFREHLGIFLRYVDLSNQQIFLRSQRRVSRRTWRQWRDGIQDNIGRRPAFSKAWQYLHSHMWRSFDELVELEKDWTRDPGWWHPPFWARPAQRVFAHLPENSDKAPPVGPAEASKMPSRSRSPSASDARDR